MYLLNEFKNEDIIVAHVNYNIREDVDIDLKIIIDFCDKNNIKLETLSLKEEYSGNFHEWARNKRYDFFQKIYNKYECKQLIIAHHKDDFLESAIMQWSSGRHPYYFGIKKYNYHFEMNIYRPMIFEYWKDEIYQLANKFNIPFNDDLSNFTDKYTRNKIRLEMNKKSQAAKEIVFKSFQLINVEKCQKNIKTIKKYIEWSELSFNIDFLIDNDKHFENLIFKFLTDNIEKININANILKAIKQFLIVKNGNKEFLLSNNRKLIKLNNNVIIK